MGEQIEGRIRRAELRAVLRQLVTRDHDQDGDRSRADDHRVAPKRAHADSQHMSGDGEPRRRARRTRTDGRDHRLRRALDDRRARLATRRRVDLPVLADRDGGKCSRSTERPAARRRSGPLPEFHHCNFTGSSGQLPITTAPPAVALDGRLPARARRANPARVRQPLDGGRRLRLADLIDATAGSERMATSSGTRLSTAVEQPTRAATSVSESNHTGRDDESSAAG